MLLAVSAAISQFNGWHIEAQESLAVCTMFRYMIPQVAGLGEPLRCCSIHAAGKNSQGEEGIESYSP
jgi:hypothetical protein